MYGVNVYEILSYGVIGLGFLLALFAYRLLSQEQRQTPREPMIKAIYFFMGFSILLCVFGFGAQVYGRNSSEPLKHSDTSPSLQDCRTELPKIKEEHSRLLEERKRLLATTVRISDLELISNAHFGNGATYEEILGTIQSLVRDSEDHGKYSNHYAFRLFELESMIGQFGANIPTDIQAREMDAPYSKIQELLKGIGCYQGLIDGNQESTRHALIQFQTNYNKRAGRIVFDPVDDYGFFGYRTLEAVRSTYRRAQ